MSPYQGNLVSLTKGVEVLETAVGALFAPTRCSLVRISVRDLVSGTDMTGRPAYRTMEMIGGSSAPYLARTPCVPLFCTLFNRVGNKERFRLPGAGGGIISIVRWNVRPVIFGVDGCGQKSLLRNSGVGGGGQNSILKFRRGQ